MNYSKKNCFVLEYKYFEFGCEFGGRYVVAEKSNFEIGNNIYSIDEDEYSEVKGKKAKELLEIANKFDETKNCYEQEIDGYIVKKYDDIPGVIYVTN